ncbi:response regulator transcription factor [Arcanobacterium haemolyticum]|nr:response regulator transcription factor [Arcanobacterium haemolyticum]
MADVSVLLADDDAVIRDGLSELLSQAEGISRVGRAANGGDVLVEMGKEHYDVLLLDVDMPVLDGITTAQIVRENYPDTTIVMLTAFEHEDSLGQALSLGVRGFLTKDIPVPVLAKLIRQAHAGQTVMGSRPTDILASNYVANLQNREQFNDLVQAVETLPDYLRPVFNLLLEARANKAIARALGLQESTVRSYVSEIFTHTKCASRGELAIKAIKAGIEGV